MGFCTVHLYMRKSKKGIVNLILHDHLNSKSVCLNDQWTLEGHPNLVDDVPNYAYIGRRSYVGLNISGLYFSKIFFNYTMETLKLIQFELHTIFLQFTPLTNCVPILSYFKHAYLMSAFCSFAYCQIW